VKTKGRTIYLPETLFERIMVQAHRKGRTISEYVTAILERQVPDYRTSRAEPSRDDEAA
jgi:predicted DNA-binding protein